MRNIRYICSVDFNGIFMHRVDFLWQSVFATEFIEYISLAIFLAANKYISYFYITLVPLINNDKGFFHCLKNKEYNHNNLPFTIIII